MERLFALLDSNPEKISSILLNKKLYILLDMIRDNKLMVDLYLEDILYLNLT